MLVHGVGRPLPKKNNDKFDSTLAENEKIINTLLQRKEAKNAYTTINTNTVTSITLDNHPTFLFLKAEIETFNEEVKTAVEDKSVIPDYSWKFSLLIGLRNLLKETVSTEDKNLKEAFLERAKQWYFEKLQKKGALPDQKEQPSRPDTANFSLRPITAGTRPFTALTRPFTSQTNRLSDINRDSVNASLIPPENESVRGGGKSFFTDTRDDILPSKLKADILKDYEDGARSRHDLCDPPYERLSEFERKIPQGILKPLSRAGARPQTSKTTTFANKNNTSKDLRFFMDKTGGVGGGTGPHSEERELSQAEFSQLGDEGAEGQDPEAVPAKAGIVVPARKNYLNDKLTALEQNIKDINIPIETRSNYAHYAPSNSVSEAKLEQRWRNAMHKKVQQKREKEEFVTKMTQWSHAKSRIDEEIARRNESNTYGSQFKNRTFVARAKSANIGSSVVRRFSANVDEANGEEEEEAEGADEEEGLDIRDEDGISEKDEDQEIDNSPDVMKKQPSIYRENGSRRVGRPEYHDFTKIRPRSVATGQQIEAIKSEPLEDKMNKLAIDRITKLHGDLLFGARNVPVDVGQDGAYNHERPTSLSVYDQSVAPKYRPFSAVYQTAKPENFRKAQMEEIEEIKAKLAKYKIKMPAKQIKASILLPELTPNANKTLPTPGAGLFVNPFYKEKKGKKKGGKKKKK